MKRVPWDVMGVLDKNEMTEEEQEKRFEETEVTIKVSPFEIESLQLLCDWWYKTATPNEAGGDQAVSDFGNGLKEKLNKALTNH